jgi:flagellar protein FliT
MLRMPSQIELYEEMNLLSARMVEAARASDWDNLIELERGVAGLRKALMNTPDNENAPAAALTRKHSLIQRILEDDAEVRRHTEPWMEHLRKYLGGSAHRRDLQKAHPTGAGESAPGGCGA